MTNLIGVRINSFNENFVTDTDQDANSVLMELDKGLRSAKIGDQCEAIVRFPKLFEKYPFPILINSSFLKLAEFFRYGYFMEKNKQTKQKYIFPFFTDPICYDCGCCECASKAKNILRKSLMSTNL